MKILVKRNINSAVVEMEIDDREDKIALSKAIVLSEKNCCDLCKSIDIGWSQNKAKSEKGEFMYIKRKCLKCGATSTLGEYQPSGTGYFWKRFEVYQAIVNREEIAEDELPIIEQ